MQRPIQLTVPGSGEPMATLLAAGGLDRRGAAVAGVVVAAREPVHRAAVPDDLRGQYRPDPVDLGSRSCPRQSPRLRCPRGCAPARRPAAADRPPGPGTAAGVG